MHLWICFNSFHVNLILDLVLNFFSGIFQLVANPSKLSVNDSLSLQSDCSSKRRLISDYVICTWFNLELNIKPSELCMKKNLELKEVMTHWIGGALMSS